MFLFLPDSWVSVSDVDNLSLLAKHRIPEVFHGADGIGLHDVKFLVIGGLPEGVMANFACEYAANFQ